MCKFNFDSIDASLRWSLICSGSSAWRPPRGEAFQDAQFKGDMVKRNGCAFEGDLSKPECSGSDFDGAKGCAVLCLSAQQT